MLEDVLSMLGAFLSNPLTVIWLGFIFFVVVVSQILSRGRRSPLSSVGAIIVAVILGIYGASVVSEQLPSLARIVAAIVVAGLPILVMVRIARR
jgi:uncharacterized membrane protein YcaP (DUF421 family)